MVLDDCNERDKFFYMLEWMLALELRYPDTLQPGLVHVTYDPTDIRSLTSDAADAAEKLGEVLSCLQQAFRTTDIVARDGLAFWILTPFTQADPVMDKIRTVIRTAPQKGLAIAESNIDMFLLKDRQKPGSPKFNNAREFLDILLQIPSIKLLSPRVNLIATPASGTPDRTGVAAGRSARLKQP